MKKLSLLSLLAGATIIQARPIEKIIHPEQLMLIFAGYVNNVQDQIKNVRHNIGDIRVKLFHIFDQNGSNDMAGIRLPYTVDILRLDAFEVIKKLNVREGISLAVLHQYFPQLQEISKHDSFSNQAPFNEIRERIKQSCNAMSRVDAVKYLKDVLLSQNVLSLINLVYLAEDHFAIELYDRMTADRDVQMFLNGHGRISLLRDYTMHAVNKLNTKQHEALALSVKYPNENRFNDQFYTRLNGMPHNEFKAIINQAKDNLAKNIYDGHAGMLFEILEKALRLKA